MSIDLINLRDISQRCSARELADIVLEIYFSSKEISFPIDIFKMLTDFGIYYQFLPFDDLEGVYSPEGEGLVATVGINSKRPYERQRFTAAHELCHHIKDHSVRVSPTNSKDPIERFADEFAGNLLAPERYLLQFAKQFENSKGYLEDDDVLRISLVFGVSFMSLYWRFINLKKIKALPSKKFFIKYQPFKKIESLGLNRLDRVFLRSIIDSYSYVPLMDTSPDWYKLKNHLIYNDGRIEGLDLDLSTVSEIMNWILKIKNLPPIYVEVSKKQEYLALLLDSDKGDTSGLVNFFLEILLKNMVISNANLSKIEHGEAVG